MWRKTVWLIAALPLSIFVALSVIRIAITRSRVTTVGTTTRGRPHGEKANRRVSPKASEAVLKNVTRRK